MMHQHDSAESLSRSTCRYSNKSSKQIMNQLTYREKTKLLPSKYIFDRALSFFSIFFRVLLYLSAPGFHLISFSIFQRLTFISSLSCPSSLDNVFQSPRLSGRTKCIVSRQWLWTTQTYFDCIEICVGYSDYSQVRYLLDTHYIRSWISLTCQLRIRITQLYCLLFSEVFSAA